MSNKSTTHVLYMQHLALLVTCTHNYTCKLKTSFPLSFNISGLSCRWGFSSSERASLFLMPWSHRCTAPSGYSLHHSTTCVCVSEKNEAAHSPLRSPCSPSRQADLCPKNWERRRNEWFVTYSVTYQNTQNYLFLLYSFTFLSRWGWFEVCPIHPAPVSLVFSLHKSNPIFVSDYNYSWNVVLEVKLNNIYRLF